MTLCLLPELRRLGWRFRFDPDRRHPAVRRALRLGVWALSYAGGYQAGLIVVLVLANKVEGGVAAYQWAYTFFYLPHALFGVPVFHVLFPEMSEHAIKGELPEVGLRMREGLRLLLFLLVPIAGFLFVAAGPLSELVLNNGAMTVQGTDLIARTLGAFAIGLPTYSIFLVLTRAFYSLSDTKTPAVVNIVTVTISSVGGAAAFFAAPSGWEVPALAGAHSVASVLGAVLLGRVLRTRVGDAGGAALTRSALRACGVGAVATIAMAAVAAVTPDTGKGGSAVAVVAIAAAGAGLYVALMMWRRADELASVRAALGRGGT